MARIPMVTRTITTTKANVLCVNILSGETFDKEIMLSRTYKTDDVLMKKIKPIIEVEDNVKALHVISKEEIKTLYGMTEDDFIKNAEILPDRTTK